MNATVVSLTNLCLVISRYDSAGLALLVSKSRITNRAEASATSATKIGSTSQSKIVSAAGVESKDEETLGLFVDKHVGKVQNLATSCSQQQSMVADAMIGIAHTRWATHGPPTTFNAHPHTSTGLAVIHNGIIENHQSLRDALKQKGYHFVSDTDTEVIAHLIRHIQSLYTVDADKTAGADSEVKVEEKKELKLEEAVCLALSHLEGAYGLCVIDEKCPNVLVGARKGSPLILGVSEDGLMLASDATAIVGKKSKVVYLMEEDVVVCTRHCDGEAGSAPEKFGYEIFNLQSSKLKQTFDHPASEVSISVVDADGNDTVETIETSAMNTTHYNILKKIHPPKQVKRAMIDLTITLDKLEKGGYEHFMLKEIMEQPNVLRDCMRGRIQESGLIKLSGVDRLKEKFERARRLIICACGTSYHSGLVGEYLIESLAKIPVEVEYASEFRYRNAVLYEDDIIIVISQSGETADTLECIRIAKKNKCSIFGIVNVVGSSIARDTDAGIYLHIGPEIGVASTKAYTGQVTALSLLALDLAQRRKTLSPERLLSLSRELLRVPEMIEAVLKKLTGSAKPSGSRDKNSTAQDYETEYGKKNYIESLASTFRYANNFLYLGRGYNYPTALEGALKLKEISYIHAEGYPAAEMKHGPIALIDALMPVIIIAPKSDKIYHKIASTVEEVRARHGNVIVVTTEGNEEFDDKCEFVIKLPDIEEEFSTLIYSVPLQLLAYYIAKLRGCEIDQPRNLAKSVTVE